MMTNLERTEALADYGFTERQARFLVLVMRHSGLCVKRQYAAFAGIANGGEKCNAFFDKLVRRGFAIAAPCVHNRARLYHVHHKPLYHAIGEADGRYRRAMSARAAADRLMRLDAALTSPDAEWFTTKSEKVCDLTSRTASQRGEQTVNPPAQNAPDCTNQFPGTFPIGIDPQGHVVLLYLATVPWTDDFRTFLIGHTALLGVSPEWTLRILFPQRLRRAVPAYQTAVHEELESPLDARTINDLSRYFFHRRRGTDPSTIPDVLRAFLIQCGQVFAGPRFAHHYRRWLADEDAALTPLCCHSDKRFRTEAERVGPRRDAPSGCTESVRSRLGFRRPSRRSCGGLLCAWTCLGGSDHDDAKLEPLALRRLRAALLH
jgi:hypothetical protein